MKEKKENISVIVSFIIVIGLIVLVVISLLNKPAKTENVENSLGDINIQDNQIKNNNQGEQAVSPTTNNMENQTTKVAKSGDTLVMNYTGRFTNGTTFDSNVDPKFGHVEPFQFTLGAGQVIKGWDEGLVGMKVGEKKTLTVPPEKGYGPNDYNGIPGGSTLIFDVELVGIK